MKIPKLKELRTQKHLTQADMGQIIGMTSQNYGRIEKGDQDLSTQQVKIICEHFNISADWLLDIPKVKEITIDPKASLARTTITRAARKSPRSDIKSGK